MTVRIERDNAVATVVIDREKALNALDLATAEALRAALAEVAVDRGVRAVVLTGAGERAFIAGADIPYMVDLRPTDALAWSRLGHTCGELLETMGKPTIAAVNGFALGGGFEMAVACDIRYASENAVFGVPEVNLGIIPGWGGTQRIARICGVGIAKELLLTGRRIDAAEAERRGLVSAVYASGELMEKTLGVARALADKGTESLVSAKQLANKALQGSHSENLEHEQSHIALLFDTEAKKEGLTAFLEKRPARFHDG